MLDPLPDFQPIEGQKLKQVFVDQCSQMILSGKLDIGSKLPSERDLAIQMGVSRPVVHEGLLDLQAMGLITLKSRFGAIVNDYRRSGSLDLLTALLRYNQNDLKPGLLADLLDLREHIETRIALLAAQNRTEQDLLLIGQIIDKEIRTDSRQIRRLVQLDFEFHLQLALASGNQVYSLLLNSFQSIYTTYTAVFYQNPTVHAAVHTMHQELQTALQARHAGWAEEIMHRLIRHGRENLQSTP
ncbi:MAG: FadR family transcriptional regulator [Leptospiraceae bacterium]|nr:FadR family transcriptional regulator [Leptospiraceae bacterium]